MGCSSSQAGRRLPFGQLACSRNAGDHVKPSCSGCFASHSLGACWRENGLQGWLCSAIRSPSLTPPHVPSVTSLGVCGVEYLRLYQAKVSHPKSQFGKSRVLFQSVPHELSLPEQSHFSMSTQVSSLSPKDNPGFCKLIIQMPPYVKGFICPATKRSYMEVTTWKLFCMEYYLG